VRSLFARPIFGLCLLALAVSPLAAQKWQIQYFYDHAKASFVVSDLAFPSATHGIAVGVIRDAHRDQPISVVTSDGGQHWDTLAIKEAPVSLFFLNESVGWMVTTKGLWQTAEAGRTWTKLPKLPTDIYRVYFLDESRGWAIGPKKTALETHDGGKTWTHLSAAAPTFAEDTDFTSYTWITFATPQIGLITGWNVPPNRYDLPSWVDPESTLGARQRPHQSYTLATSDGGVNWTAAAKSLYGTIARVRFGPDGKGLGLLQYAEAQRFPSEVYTVEWPSGTSHTVYRDTKFAISDIWLSADGTAYAAGTIVRGKLRNVMPEKLQVLTSKDFETWTPIPVDYRAEANSVMLAGSGDHVWMATDSGMILKLVR
jgi:photosystem II stability/assembly factor-like uncharacterized protein